MGILILLQTPTWINGFTVMLALIGFIVAVASAWILITANRRSTVSIIQKEQVTANEGLAKARLELINDCEVRCKRCNEELEDVTAELRTKAALDIEKLMYYWQIRDVELAESAKKDALIRQLKMRLGDPV